MLSITTIDDISFYINPEIIIYLFGATLCFFFQHGYNLQKFKRLH